MFLHFLSLKLDHKLKTPDVTYMSSAEEEEWEVEPFTAHTTPRHMNLPITMKVGDKYIYLFYPLQSINLCQMIENISL